jgi:hypothetical protein
MVGSLTGLFERRFLLTSWLPTSLFWTGLFALAATAPGWAELVRWWTAQPGEVHILFAAVGLAWTTFTASLLAANAGGIIRLCEGYWPNLPILRGFHARRRAHYLALHTRLHDDPAGYPRMYGNYPARSASIKPTRLGNILQSAEDYPADRYEINAIIAWPRLYLVLPDRMLTALGGAKANLDLMANLIALSAAFAVLGTATAAVTTPWYGPILCAFGGLALAWLSYEGAVREARPYAQLICAAFDLHRNLLLTTQGLTPATSYGQERRQWRELSHLWYQGAPSGPEGAKALGYPLAVPGRDGAGTLSHGPDETEK